MGHVGLALGPGLLKGDVLALGHEGRHTIENALVGSQLTSRVGAVDTESVVGYASTSLVYIMHGHAAGLAHMVQHGHWSLHTLTWTPMVNGILNPWGNNGDIFGHVNAHTGLFQFGSICSILSVCSSLFNLADHGLTKVRASTIPTQVGSP